MINPQGSPCRRRVAANQNRGEARRQKTGCPPVFAPDKLFIKIHKCIDFVMAWGCNSDCRALVRARSLTIEEIDRHSVLACQWRPWLTVQPASHPRMKSNSDPVRNVLKRVSNVPKRPKRDEKRPKMGSKWVAFFKIIGKTSVCWLRLAQPAKKMAKWPLIPPTRLNSDRGRKEAGTRGGCLLAKSN